MTRGPRMLPQPVGQEFVDAKAPPDWDAVFGFSGPLELEIGCGYGGFAIEYAARHPAVRYVAFEWRKKWARHVQSLADGRGLKNLRVVEADAKREIPLLFKPGSISVIHLQFPDPWWKRAHQKRAILSPEFTKFLLELTVPGGIFEMRTDVEDRALAMIEALENAGYVNPLGPRAFHPPEPDDVPSSRERRYLAAGEPVYRARLVKPR
ncbi:MAG: tRNA (guanosine(46)-N7)-methyltransferase TrmB [Myxococcaceae bacterium]